MDMFWIGSDLIDKVGTKNGYSCDKKWTYGIISAFCHKHIPNSYRATHREAFNESIRAVQRMQMKDLLRQNLIGDRDNTVLCHQANHRANSPDLGAKRICMKHKKLNLLAHLYIFLLDEKCDTCVNSDC